MFENKFLYTSFMYFSETVFYYFFVKYIDYDARQQKNTHFGDEPYSINV